MVVGLANLDKAVGHDGTSNREQGEPGGACGGKAPSVSKGWEAAWRGPILDHGHVVHRLHPHRYPCQCLQFGSPRAGRYSAIKIPQELSGGGPS